MKGIYWFRRDLRLQDNLALNTALNECSEIILLHIVDDTNERFKLGGASKWWLHHSLYSLINDLNKHNLSLVLLKGDTHQILSTLVKKFNIEKLYFNHTLDDIEADKKIALDLKKLNCSLDTYWENLLIKPNVNNYKKIFTPFWKSIYPLIENTKPYKFTNNNKIKQIKCQSLLLEDLELLPTKPNWSLKLEKHWHQGEAAAQKRLKFFLENSVATYNSDRDIPSIDKTSKLSPHLHFGEISPRQIWYKTMEHTDGKAMYLKGSEHFLRELGWREFAYHTMNYFYEFPSVSMRSEFENFPWKNSESLFNKWKFGKTGYPIVDAGMRQLYETGWLHNRVRMIVGSFLVKHLLLPWQLGANWFLDTLVDADLSSNSAGWQWVAGCGVDSAPYFRIFNPIIQGEKFDPEGEYVKTYCPELKNLPAKYIHKPWEAPTDVLSACKIRLGVDYPKPIVDHIKARTVALEAFEKIKK